jgi:hypothetical protein
VAQPFSEGREMPPTPETLTLDVDPNRIAAFRGGAWIDELGTRTLTKIC